MRLASLGMERASLGAETHGRRQSSGRPARQSPHAADAAGADTRSVEPFDRGSPWYFEAAFGTHVRGAGYDAIDVAMSATAGLDLPPGIAFEDGVAALHEDENLVEIVSAREMAAPSASIAASTSFR